MIYRRMLIAIVIVVSLVQFTTCTNNDKPDKDSKPTKGKPLGRTDTLSKSRAPTQGRVPNKDGAPANNNVPPRTRSPTRSKTPPPQRARSLPRSASDDDKKPNKQSQVVARPRNVQQPEEKVEPKENATDKGTDKQSTLLMPIRAIQKTGSFLVKSAFNTLKMPFNAKNKAKEDNTE